MHLSASVDARPCADDCAFDACTMGDVGRITDEAGPHHLAVDDGAAKRPDLPPQIVRARCRRRLSHTVEQVELGLQVGDWSADVHPVRG